MAATQDKMTTFTAKGEKFDQWTNKWHSSTGRRNKNTQSCMQN